MFATPSSCAIWRRFRLASLLYCITLRRLMTFRSAIFARSVRISSCTPSAKKALSGLRLKFSNGNTATLFSGAVCAKGGRLRETKIIPARIAAANVSTIQIYDVQFDAVLHIDCAKIVQQWAPSLVLFQIFGHMFRKKNVTRIAAVHHPLRHVQPGTGEIGATGNIEQSTDRAA